MKTAKKILCTVLVLIMLSAMIMPLGLTSYAVDPPNAKAHEAALVYNVEADRVLWSDNADAVVYPAALTKLMTAVLAIEYVENGGIGLYDGVTVTTEALLGAAGNTMNLVAGEILTMNDLLGAMLLVGANDAALVIANEVCGSADEFVVLMNERAKELGMNQTVFTNPTGLHDWKMVTTASDMLLLARFALKQQVLMDIVGKERVVIEQTNRSDTRYYGTRNYLVSNKVTKDYYLSSATGMICGSTQEAGYCIIASAQHESLNYISIVMGAGTVTVKQSDERVEIDEDGKEVIIPAVFKTLNNSFLEAAELLKWAYKNYKFIKAVDSSTPICQINVRLARDVDKVTLLPEKAIELYVPNDIDMSDITYSWTLTSDSLNAPVKAGTEVGTLTIKYEGEIIGDVPLIVKSNIESDTMLTFLDGASRLFSTPLFKVIFIIIIVGAAAYVITTAVTRQKRKNAVKREYMKNKNYYLK